MEEPLDRLNVEERREERESKQDEEAKALLVAVFLLIFGVLFEQTNTRTLSSNWRTCFPCLLHFGSECYLFLPTFSSSLVTNLHLEEKGKSQKRPYLKPQDNKVSFYPTHFSVQP